MGLQRICKLLKKNRIGGRLFPISNKKRVKHLVDKKKSIKVGNSRLLLENLFLKIRKLKKIEQLKLDKIQRLDRSTNRKILMKIDYKGTHYTKLKLLNNQKYSYFFSNFFYKIFKNPVYFINFNYFLKIKVVSFKKLVNNLFFKNKFIKKTIYMYKILRVALASLVFKDSKILVYVIKEVFEAVHYSRHRIYFYFWQKLLKQYLSGYYKKLNVYGVRLEFHGKLGVGGNSKKRSYYYSIGRCSNSTKYFKIDTSSSIFNTDTGVVGFTYSIFY